MSNKQKSSNSKRGAGMAIAICFAAAVIMAGTYALNGLKEAKEQELAMLEEEQKSKTANAEKLVINTEKRNDTEDTDMGSATEMMEGEEKTEENAASETVQTAGANISVNFTESSHVLWPVDGNLLMGYSMDQTVYFSTLDQYKYNPAMIIAGAEGDQVIAGAAGIVKSIDNTAQTGLTVNIDLGNGYEVFYGQLKDVPLNVGDYVTANTVVGYVAQPTKYYVAEGCNVYFEMRKDGQAIDPLEYIEQ